MTDEQINRRVAELLEPILPPQPTPCPSGYGWYWKPRDFVHDWNCTGMLLERMAIVRIERWRSSTGLLWYVVPDGKYGVLDNYGEDQQLPRAVALAFLKMHEAAEGKG